MTDEKRKDDEELDPALAALARPSDAPPAADDDDDDDGVLDLRALASSMAPPAPADSEDDGQALVSTAPAAAEAEADDDEPAEPKAAPAPAAKSGGTATSGKTEAAAPVAPIADAPSGGSGKILVGLVVLVAVAAIGWAVFLRGDGEETVAELDPPMDTGSIDTAPTVTEEPELAEEPVAEVETEPEAVAEAEAEAEAAAEAEAEAETEAAPSTRRRGGGSPAAASAMSAEPAATMEATMEPEPAAMEEEPATMEESSMGSVEDLLDRAIGGNAPPPTMEAPAAMETNANLPETPSRAAVTRALSGLMSRMRQCAGDQVGIATARIRVSNDGQVQSANIGGRPFGGTPQGSCMENVVKTARFPRFTRTHFDVTYPFSIRPLN